MNEHLTLKAGHGRVIRTPNLVAFSTGAIQGLTASVSSNDHDRLALFRSLASLIVASDFTCEPVAVVSLPTGAEPTISLLLFGELTISLGDGSSLDGSSKATWIEIELSPAQASRIEVGQGQDLAETELAQGSIPAGGFVWSTSDSHQVEGPAPIPDEASQNHQCAEALPVKEPDPLGTFDGLVLDDDSVSTEERAEDLEAGPFDLTMDASPDELLLPNELGLGDQVGHVTDSLAVSAQATTLPRMKPADIGSTSSAGQRWVVCLDDGSDHIVDGVVVVGRNPDLSGLGDSCSAIKVASSRVSRQHWEIEVRGGRAYVRDVGSSGGTRAEAPGESSATIVPSESPLSVRPGTVVHFGDRSARIETRTSFD